MVGERNGAVRIASEMAQAVGVGSVAGIESSEIVQAVLTDWLVVAGTTVGTHQKLYHQQR